MNNNKIYITNFWWTNNYGACLTAYALQNIIKNSVLINNKENLSLYRGNVDHLDISKIFGIKYLCCTDEIQYFNEFRELENYSNCFVVGSDQVLRVSGLTANGCYQNLLEYLSHNTKKIAFAASFGIDKNKFLLETNEKLLKRSIDALKSFDFISVREKSGVEICRDVLGVDAEWIIDPVFIYNDWNKLLNNATQKYEGKIISYVLDTGKDYKNAYKYLSKKYNCEVVETANSNISVENWLKSIKDCELFVTDSFHGMCFAIIFNKPFICLANKERGRARFDSICEMLGIENQCVDSILEVLERDCVFKIDYEKVNKRVEEERQRGLDFLQKALDAPIQVTQTKIDSRMTYLENRVIELEKECNLKYQIKKELWNLWLVIWYKYLPKPLKFVINLFRKREK